MCAHRRAPSPPLRSLAGQRRVAAVFRTPGAQPRTPSLSFSLRLGRHCCLFPASRQSSFPQRLQRGLNPSRDKRFILGLEEDARPFPSAPGAAADATGASPAGRWEGAGGIAARPCARWAERRAGSPASGVRELARGRPPLWATWGRFPHWPWGAVTSAP